ncbi:MAG: hypothetical protein V4619_13065, partial [Bacteroidota bacterium]
MQVFVIWLKPDFLLPVPLAKANGNEAYQQQNNTKISFVCAGGTTALQTIIHHIQFCAGGATQS